MRLALAWCAALVLTGCAWTNNNVADDERLSDSRRTMAPDGAPAWAIACTRSVTECYDECARRCPTGYQILDRNDEEQESRSVSVNGQGFAGQTWTRGRSRSSVGRISMLIECRARYRTPAAGPAEDDESPK